MVSMPAAVRGTGARQARSVTQDLASLHQAVSPTGPSIDLDSNAGNADARDHEFTAYRD